MSPTESHDPQLSRFDADRVVDPALVEPEHLTVAGDDHAARGRSRGEQAARGIALTVDAYSALFTRLGIPLDQQRAAAEQSLEALESWDPNQVVELTGVAAGAGLELWQVGLVDARTEILALAEVQPLECSTLVHAAPGAAKAVQTWDWHAEFADVWHYQSVTGVGGELDHHGFAEFGMRGKIGMNSARVGVMLNILRNARDAAGGVPVHSILAGVLARARSVEEAVEIIRSAPTTSSSVITVTGPEAAAMVEIGPAGTQVLTSDGWFAHTNHFVGSELLDGALPLNAGSMSEERLALLESRVADAPAPADTAEMLGYMCTGPGEAPVCRVAEAGRGFGERAATLVTVQFDPAAGRVVMSPGSPNDVGRTESTEFSVS
ncbi:C45 family autoproteolytic acyltransferase/hydolase [Brevibacterium ihuae]|uniref:C45 family autoproteolytic acyltransferase/hydolase n=1 Tax=Brevibacterium ihuae TaxID=1631743 RepID=UPI0015E11F9D|nr:C45 family peptidase [Brevibacterium ihuae]